MVSTWCKVTSSALTRMDVATETELLRKDAVTQVLGSRECQSLSLVSHGVGNSNLSQLWSGRWPAQPGGRAERGSRKVKKYQGVWEGDKLMGAGSHHTGGSRLWPHWDGQQKKNQEPGEPESSHCKTEGSISRDKNEWMQVHTKGGRQTPPFVHLTLPGASIQQVWGSVYGWPVNGWGGWRSIHTRVRDRVRKAHGPYYDHLHEEVKKGYSCRWLPPEINKGSNMPSRYPHREVYLRLLPKGINSSFPEFNP